MMSSMMSGISGLRNHQTAMDVIGNNIANVNTSGFKASRVTFSEVFSNTIANATAPNSETGTGGTNTMQIGMGSSIASIDLLYTEGSIDRTDNPLDVSIDGNGLFIVKESNSSGYTFTRSGSFGIDKRGNLVTSSGALVCGWQKRTQSANAIEPDGFESTMDVEPINVYLDSYNGNKQIIDPQPTTHVVFSGNLNANSDTGAVVTVPMSLYDNYGYEVQANMTLTKEENLSGSNTVIYDSSDAKIAKFTPGVYVERLYNTQTTYTQAATGAHYSVPMDYVNGDGSLNIFKGTDGLEAGKTAGEYIVPTWADKTVKLRGVKEQNIAAGMIVPMDDNFTDNRYVVPASVDTNVVTKLINLKDAKAVAVGEIYDLDKYVVPDSVALTGVTGGLITQTDAGGATIGDIIGGQYVVPDTVDTTTVTKLINEKDAKAGEVGKVYGENQYVVADNFDISRVNGLIKLGAAGADGKVREGTVMANGSYVVPDQITGVRKYEAGGKAVGQVVNEKYVIPYGTDGISEETCKITTDPRYVEIVTTKEVSGYQEVSKNTKGALKVLASEEDMSINEWTFSLTVNGKTVKDMEGNPITGKIVFGNGDKASEDYGEVIKLTVNGKDVTDYKLDVESAYDNKPDNSSTVSFDFSSLTQYAAKDSAYVYDSNGFPTGTLQDYSIGADGVITGVYSNGKQQTLGMIALANFDNPNGLKSVGGSSYTQTANSGEFRAIVPGAEAGSLASNTLEMSNVDLSTEFTNMIIYQRGFQANSRTITTADEMLQELVNLKR